MHRQPPFPRLCLFLAFIIPTFVVPTVARNSHRGLPYPGHNHQRLARLIADAVPSTLSSRNNNETSVLNVIKSLDDPRELIKRDGTKYVFMHHIVGNTYPYTLQDWKDDLSAIQSKGVDALALNIGSDDWERTQVSSAYAAALALDTGLKLFISFDFTAMSCSVSDVVSLVNQHASHPNHFRINGKPMISSYSGDCLGNSGWASIKAQTNGYLMPFMWGLEGQFNAWTSLDSWYCWGCAWPQGNYDKSTDDDNYYLSQLGSKYATTISGWFYTHYSYKNEVLRSDDWLVNSRWEQLIAMRDKLTFVEMVTWNDYGESDYFGPIKGAQPSGTTWADNFPHTAWFDMSQYYITAFKTGIYPSITQDVVYYWARPHPASATASADNLPRPSGSTWTQDYLWAAVFATGPCTVTLTSGSQSQTFTLQSGVSKIKMPLSPGGISVKMVKGSQTIINKSPTDFTFVTNPKTYNYNAYVGSASADGNTVATSTASTSTATSTTSPTSVPASWAYAGCYIDSTSSRVLNGFSNSLTTQTVASCLATCQQKGFAYAGTEYAKECWCGASITSGSKIANAGDCSTPCAGKSTDICGGGNRLSLYKFTGSPTVASTPPTSTPSTQWNYVGCYVDSTITRVLNGFSNSLTTQTVASCLTTCQGKGFTYAGTEYAKECWCGAGITPGSKPANAGDCSTPCAGKSTDMCGGGNRLSLYHFA